MKKALLLVGALLALPAHAEPSALQHGLYWNMDFGLQQTPVAARYGFAVGHPLGQEQPAAPIARVDVTDHGMLAQVAGFALTRSFRLDQQEDAAGTEPPQPRPWYARRWVWWTGLGLAATAAVVAGSDASEENDENNPQAPNDDPDGGSQGGIGCVNGECVLPCGETGPINSCNGFAAADRRGLGARLHDAVLDQGTGGMGDLPAR